MQRECDSALTPIESDTGVTVKEKTSVTVLESDTDMTVMVTLVLQRSKHIFFVRAPVFLIDL